MNQVRYQLELLDFVSHYYRVTLEVTPCSVEPMRLRLPAWIPGSYMVRDFARNIQAMQVVNHQGTLPWHQVDKQTWQVAHGGSPFQLSYVVYAYDLSVRANYFNDEIAVVNPAACCLEVADCGPLSLTVLPGGAPEHWQVATGLTRAENTAPLSFGEYVARDYAQLIDCPLLIGDIAVRSFVVAGVTHHHAVVGAWNADYDRVAEDLRRICDTQRQVFGELPADLNEYWFLTWVVDKGYGGLEHRNSTLLLCNRFDLPNPRAPEQLTDDYVTFLGLCSHEYFHTWWVKRARPKVFSHYQLDAEQYTDQLWLYEGFTSYFDDLALVHCGLINKQRYLTLLSETISRVERASNQHRQSLRASSFNAWTMYYKQDENAQNAVTNYYGKGSLVALCLEAQLQQRGLSLAGFMQACWQAYGRNESGSDWSLLAQILDGYTGDSSLSNLLWQWIDEAKPLPLVESLAALGVTMTSRAASNQQDVSGVKTFVVEPRGFGAWYEFKPEGMHISAVAEYSAAKQAGLMAGDIVIAAQGLKLSETSWREILQRTAADLPIELHLFRQQRLVCLTLPAESAAATVALLQFTADQPQVERWLGN